MKLGIATVSISGTLDEKIDAIAGAGFDGIEIFEQDFIADTRPPRAVGQRIREAGLELMLFQPFRDFEGLPGDLRRKAFDRAERKFDLMQELGCELVLVCSSVHPDALGGIDRAADDFAELGERAGPRGLRIGFEALAWGRHVDDHRDAWEIVRRADHPNVGLILDSFHTLGRGIDPDTIRRIPGDRIFFVQLADAPKIDMDLLYWSRHFRNMPGEGDLDVPAFMRAVMATGYEGPASLEIFNDQFRGGPAQQIAQAGKRALLNLMDDVRRTEPNITVALPPMPAPTPPTAVEFVEFATRGAEAEALSRLLETMGFRHTAQHKTKDLALWQQGSIRILLNAETRGHADTSYIARGTNVCDLGLRVPSATDAMGRALALGASPFLQPRQTGEMDLPAIRGLGGSVLHFVDGGTLQVWDVEFDPVASSGPDAGLIAVDHVAQTMGYEEMLSWSLFYTTLFGLGKEPMIDVIDPDGLVRSQALSSPNGGVRITLNGADTHRTLAGGFLAESFGASVQHVAFATDDIFATARALDGTGFRALPMPENYYADLASRFDLAPAMLEAMARANILYERDGGAEFFQLYSRPFLSGLFFEIVQRSDGYTGYGAANAPFRIAALKRLGRGRGIPRG
ncbi:bifunctional sugar phosphate isomerase/epimerase/4-hydroxyphenylpyruvate dioxygenase family protein [Hasllibacter sp. MH4015]|uniref:bifunctional sugar phosphate isomerase/epimerase/4-hydroxyphenylpyruvate dioxygenase family protein n=1 Tax=Hasllibacter sp. MH4015 TaxID=2854029 RepID=UPI001CD580CC|nr:sugar phosphate isomerase/epimerase and 4-hydroxyphenylpyruvate domain-containing protein [Hasllibacter sp. MH4015]